MSISRNAAYNAVGSLLPSILTVVTVPLYLQVVGVERYGILALCWLILGYSGFLELGLGPAVSQRIAASRGGDHVQAEEAFWTGFWLSLVLGIVGAAVIYLGASLYFSRVAEVGSAFRSELAAAVPLIASIVPILMLSSVLSGGLGGRERFLALNVIGAIGATLLALLPLVFAYLWKADLSALIAGALVARLVPVPLLFWHSKRAVPLAGLRKPSPRAALGLLSFGGWMSVGAVAVAIIAGLDRLAIGGIIGAAAVTAYSIPLSLITRIVLIPHSVGPALYPRFAYADVDERKRLLSSGIQAVAVLVTPICIGLVAIAEPFFTLWIGPELTVASAPLVYLLAPGQWFYCIGYPAASMLQGSGSPSRVSKLLVAELVPFGVALLISLWTFGLAGAALVVTLRAVVDCGLILRLAEVRLVQLTFLTIPSLLILASAATAAVLPNPFRSVVLAVLFIASAIWSVRNAPEVLRPYLKKLAAILPLPRGNN